MGEVSQQLFLGDTEVFGIYDNRWSAINPVPYVEPWTPANFTDIQYWWKADAGLTMNSSDPSKVEKWTDQINNFELTQSFNSNPNFTALERMPTTSSAWAPLNNQPIVRFGMVTNASLTNAPQYLYSPTNLQALSNQSATQIIICEYISRNASYSLSAPLIGVIRLGTNVNRMWFDRQLADGDLRSVNGLGAASLQIVDTNKNVPLGTEIVAWQQYDEPNGDQYFALNNTTGSLVYNGTLTAETWAADTIYTINGFVDGTAGSVGSLFEIRANDMAVAEVIMIYGKPSASEWAEFKSYVSTKYGLSIS